MKTPVANDSGIKFQGLKCKRLMGWEHRTTSVLLAALILRAQDIRDPALWPSSSTLLPSSYSMHHVLYFSGILQISFHEMRHGADIKSIANGCIQQQQESILEDCTFRTWLPTDKRCGQSPGADLKIKSSTFQFLHCLLGREYNGSWGYCTQSSLLIIHAFPMEYTCFYSRHDFLNQWNDDQWH